MLQLSLKPQKSTNWQYTATGNYSEYAADTTLFGSLSNSYNDTTDSIVPHLDAVAVNVPNGNWQSYYQTGVNRISIQPELFSVPRSQVGAATPQPFSGVKACGTAALNGGNNGLYQRVYGLEDGKSYNIQFTLVNPLSPDANSIITVYDLTSGASQTFTALSTGTNTYELEFEANGNTADVCINIFSVAAECFYVKKASVKEHYSSVDYTYSNFEDGSVELDLFDDHIPLLFSVASFTDATVNTQSYSKDFKLPSTKNNDRIFTHIYDINSSIKGNVNAFNPYIKTVATLKEDGIEIFSGELTLNSISKNKEGITYDVNLQSRVSGLAEVLKNKKITNLDFSELNHDYTSVNIKNSWTTGLVLSDGSTTADVKYPFVNWNGSIIDEDRDGDIELVKLEDAFRPFIRAKHILDKIFVSSGFRYESNFLNSAAFTDLFMDLNHGEESLSSTAGTGGGGFIVEADPSDATRWFAQTWSKFRVTDITSQQMHYNSAAAGLYWDSANYSFSPVTSNTTVKLNGNLPIFNDSNIRRSGSFRTVIERANGNKEYVSADGFSAGSGLISIQSRIYKPTVTATLGLGDKIYFQCKTDSSDTNKIRQQINSDLTSAGNTTWINVTKISDQVTDLEAMLDVSRGDLSQWDFLKSFMNMFNLIISPSDDMPSVLVIEPYDSVFGLHGYGNVIDDPYFTGALDSGISTDNGVTAQIDSAGDLKVLTNSTATVSFASLYYPYHDFIDGETYTAKIKVLGFTANRTFKFAVQRNGGLYHDLVIDSAGEHEFSFVFDKAANGGFSSLRVRLYMTGAMSQTTTLRVSELSVVGKLANTIVKKDWSDKVDIDSFDIKMMDLDERVDFKFTEDEGDSAANQYTRDIPPFDGRSYRYGNAEYRNSEYTSLTGVSTISVKPFASTIVKSIDDYTAVETFITPAIYTQKGDNEFGVYKNKPRLLYDNGVATTTANYSSPVQNGVAGFSNESDYLQFTHFSAFSNDTGADENALDLNWTNCQSMVSNESPNGLFNEYWSTYYSDLYDADTRIYTVTAHINNNDISNFEFTDIIIIENSQFRVNNINYNAGGMSKIELIKLT